VDLLVTTIPTTAHRRQPPEAMHLATEEL